LALKEKGMDHDQALSAFHAGDILEAVVKPAEDANGWVLELLTRSGEPALYTGHTGTEKVYHTLDQATEIAREIGFHRIRVEERF
jgi:uncharacterized protein CbrC (UPF0167 family)